MGRHNAPGPSPSTLATAPPPAAPTIFVEPGQPTPAAPGRHGRHAAAHPGTPTRTAAPAGVGTTPGHAREIPRIAAPVPPVEAPAAPVVPAEPIPPAAAQHHRHAARPVHQTSQGPGLDVLAWTGFAAVVAWAIIAAGHDLSDATAWVLGVAALVPVALLTLAPTRLRERRARRRDQ